MDKLQTRSPTRANAEQRGTGTIVGERWVPKECSTAIPRQGGVDQHQQCSEVVGGRARETCKADHLLEDSMHEACISDRV